MLLQRDQIRKALDPLQKKGKRIVFTNGCFDILHLGHVVYLQQARALGDALFVGLNSDSSVKQLGKGPDRPIQNESDRAQILLALKAVDFVSIFPESTPLELIKIVQPQVLVKGGDWAPEKIVGSEFVQSHGGEVRSLPFVEGRSTSVIVDKIRRL
jgi:rfaE bifunctional protein nucleotidyltransferase chain/domain